MSDKNEDSDDSEKAPQITEEEVARETEDRCYKAF